MLFSLFYLINAEAFNYGLGAGGVGFVLLSLSWHLLGLQIRDVGGPLLVGKYSLYLRLNLFSIIFIRQLFSLFYLSTQSYHL